VTDTTRSHIIIIVALAHVCVCVCVAAALTLGLFVVRWMRRRREWCAAAHTRSSSGQRSAITNRTNEKQNQIVPSCVCVSRTRRCSYAFACVCVFGECCIYIIIFHFIAKDTTTLLVLEALNHTHVRLAHPPIHKIYANGRRNAILLHIIIITIIKMHLLHSLRAIMMRARHPSPTATFVIVEKHRFVCRVCATCPPPTRPSFIFPARVLLRRRRLDYLISYCCRVIDRHCRCTQVVRRVGFFELLLQICVFYFIYYYY